MATLLEEVWNPSEGDVEHGAIDCSPYLDAGETVNGTPTVFDTGSSGDLSFTNEAASTTELDILGRKVDAGLAVQFSYEGQNAGTTYRVRVTFTTSASRTKVVDQLIECAS